ncbi:MAG: ribokinase [Paracoccaceae bacterium]
MAIFNLGSINADMFYKMERLPQPGETLAAQDHSRGLGGKGANQSVAVARAGSKVTHLGAVGVDGGWAVDILSKTGVETRAVTLSDHPTGHAIIAVDAQGENNIILWPGANRHLSQNDIETGLASMAPDDTLLLQNETNGQIIAAKLAHAKGARVIYSAAPFSVDSVQEILPLVSLLIVNQLEARQLSAALNTDIQDIPVAGILITMGAKGAVFYDRPNKAKINVASPKVDAIDTTGAGDTFAGYFAAGLDQGQGIQQAMESAAAAAACKVTRHGTAEAIPTADEVLDFLKKHPSG